MIAGEGDLLPVSALPVDGTFPTDTARWEKRRIAREIPIWDPSICIDCAKCALVCPHAAIRMKVFEPAAAAGAPGGLPAQGVEGPRAARPADDDPGRARRLHRVRHLRRRLPGAQQGARSSTSRSTWARRTTHLDDERANWFDFFLTIPDPTRADVRADTVKGSQQLRPLFEFSGACAGCGETPYLKVLTQLFGDRMLVANATGCSSIYGGNLPTTPWASDADGRGPAWSNSLFEDNAEFGLGHAARRSTRRRDARRELLRRRWRTSSARRSCASSSTGIARRAGDEAIARQRLRVDGAPRRGSSTSIDPRLRDLEAVADALVPTSVWIVGGDGWAYDIGFGGLDHVLATGRDVNVLVLDTEVYSNTGGQASKATPRGAVAKFAAAGKASGKKDLGMIATAYGNVYVGADRDGRRHAAHGEGAGRGRGAPGPVARDRLQPLHRARHRHVDGDEPPEGRRGDRATGRCTGSTRGRRGRASTRSISTPSGRRIPLKAFTAKEARLRDARSAPTPIGPRHCWASAQDDVDARWRLYEQIAGVDRGPRPRGGPDGPSPRGGETRHERRPSHAGTWGWTSRTRVVPSASPLGQRIETLRRCRTRAPPRSCCPRCSRSRSSTTRSSSHGALEAGAESYAEALTYLPEFEDYNTGTDAYLRHLEATEARARDPGDRRA